MVEKKEEKEEKERRREKIILFTFCVFNLGSHSSPYLVIYMLIFQDIFQNPNTPFTVFQIMDTQPVFIILLLNNVTTYAFMYLFYLAFPMCG